MSVYALLGCDKCLPSISHSDITGKIPQSCESLRLLSLKYIYQYFYFVVSNLNQQTLNGG